MTRRDLVRYAGASGDFNVIHWNERIAKSVGLPDVIAHGMLTMALAGRFLAEWAGRPGGHRRVRRPVLRAGRGPDDDKGATVEFAGTVDREARRQPGRGRRHRPVGGDQGARPGPAPSSSSPVRLADCTTIGLGGPARYFVRASTDGELIDGRRRPPTPAVSRC